MGIEVTHCHRQIITYDGGGEQRAQVVMVAAWQGNVFSLLLFFVLFCFSAQTKEATEPKNIAHPKTRNHLKFTTNFFFFLFFGQKIYKNLGQRNQIRNHVKFTLNFFLNFPNFFLKIYKKHLEKNLVFFFLTF